MAVPIIDISAFTTSSSSKSIEQRRETAKALITAFSSNGYVGITGYGLPPDMIPTTFSLGKKFFALPDSDKLQASASTSSGGMPRGFTQSGVEHAGKSRGKSASDHKETFDVGGNPGYPNLWPSESTLPGFQSFLEDLYSRLDALCHTILDTLILGMSLNEDERIAIKKLHRGLDNQLRIAHYLPFSQQLLESEELTRLGAHRDWSTFTILFQDIHAGLEFQDRASGEFVPAPPQEGLLYLNVGDMLERLSNGLLSSSLHRVVVPQALRRESPESGESVSIPSRFSIPFFFCPAPDGLIAPQATCVKEDGGAKYKALTFKEYAAQMFRAARGEIDQKTDG